MVLSILLPKHLFIGRPQHFSTVNSELDNNSGISRNLKGARTWLICSYSRSDIARSALRIGRARHILRG